MGGEAKGCRPPVSGSPARHPSLAWMEPCPAAICSSLPEDHPIGSNVNSSPQYNRGCWSNQFCTHGILVEGEEEGPDRTITWGRAGGECSTAARAAARDARTMGPGKSPTISDSDEQAPTARATGQPPMGTTVCRAGW